MSAYWLASNTPRLLAGSAGVFLPPTIKMVIYMALGIYCLGAGQMIVDWLNNEPSGELAGEESEVLAPSRFII